MSDYGLFEAAQSAEQEPRRKQRIAARQMAAALSDIHNTFGTFMANADGADNFEDRWATVRADVRKTLLAHQIGTYPAVMREAYGHLKKAWIATQAANKPQFEEPKDDKDRDLTINDRQKSKIDKGDKSVTKEVDSNSGDGSDAEGNKDDGFGGKKAPPFGKKDSRHHHADQPTPGVDTSAVGTAGGMMGDGSAAPNAASGISSLPAMGAPAGSAVDAGPSSAFTGTDSMQSMIGGGSPTGGAPAPAQRGANRRQAEDRSAPFQDIQNTYHPSGGDVHNEGNFDRYLDEVDQGGPEAVDGHDFIPGGDGGADSAHREAMQLVADLYLDWAHGNNLRHASMNTLDVYAANGLHDQDYYLLAGLIRRAECDCDDEDDDSDDSGPPESSDSGDDSDGDSESDDGGGEEESDSGDDSGNPFAGGDDSGDEGDDEYGSEDDDSDFGGEDPDASADAGPDFGGGEDEEADDEGGPDGFGDAPEEGGDPSQDAGPGDDVGGGQDFTVPDQAPDLPPEAMDQIPQDDTSGDQPIAPEVIDQILGLPPGTLEALVMEELQGGGGGAPPGGPPPGGPQLARRRVAAEDPTEAAGGSPSAAPAAPAQMPAAPPAGAGSAGTMAPPGSASVAPPPAPMPLENQPAEDALLDTALQSVTQMIDTETQEYQQMIDPLTQALQAIEFAQQVETAENPLDVTPPDGTVNAAPSAAPGGSDSQEKAARIANRYKLSEEGYGMLLEAMSRKHYEHVGEAIRSLPEELRPGIANHIGAMFKEDNSRFNHDQWLDSVGARSFTAAGAGNTPTLDSFEFPGVTPTGKPVQQHQTDPYAIDDLGKGPNKMAKGVLKQFQDYTKVRTDKGLNNGDLGNESAFESENAGKLGPKALDKVRSTVGVPPAAPAAAATTKTPKQASFFTRRVPGWKWDDHLAGYISREARNFTCSCGNDIPTPSYGTCRCGKLWNSYAIGDGHHLAGNSADMFITREIPVRDDVIVANRQLQGWTSDSGWTPPDQRDVDWVEDEDREDADAPHAPGKTAAQVLAWDAAAVKVAELVGQSVSHVNDPSLQGTVTHADPSTGTAWVQHPGGHHEFPLHELQSTPAQAGPSLKDKVRDHLVNRMQNGGFAGGRSAFFQEGALRDDDYIVKYDDDEDPSRKGGPKKPPSTTVKGGDPKWHSRGGPGDGKFKSTSPFKG